MIKFRINPLGPEYITVDHQEGETIAALIRRSFIQYGGVPSDNFLAHCIVTVQYKEIDSDLWDTLTVDYDAEVLITLKIQGEGLSTAGRAALSIGGLALGAALLAGPLGLTGIAYGLGMAVVSIGTGLIVNGLIPIPEEETKSSAPDAYEESQMFSIDKQNNSAKRYGSVPRVYGTFRMFPNVAGSAYLEYAANNAGDLTQTLIALYDFGIGPNLVSEIQIGNTPIEAFSGVKYNIVDTNKPLVGDEWDEELLPKFLLYKGVASRDFINRPLNKNSTGGFPGDTSLNPDSSITFNAPFIPDATSQEITVQMVCPNGLNSESANRDRGFNRITLAIDYRNVGASTWTPLQNSSDWGIQGAAVLASSSGAFLKKGEMFGGWYRVIGDTRQRYIRRLLRFKLNIDGDRYGLYAGQTQIVTETFLPIGSLIKIDGITIGTVAVAQFVSSGPYGSYCIITLASGIPQDIELFRRYNYHNVNTTSGVLLGQVLGGFARLPPGATEQQAYSIYNRAIVSVRGFSNFPIRIMGRKVFKLIFFRVTKNIAFSSITASTTPLQVISKSALQLTSNRSNETHALLSVRFNNNIQKQIRVTRVLTNPDYSTRQTSNLIFASLTTRALYVQTVRTPLRHTFLEVAVTATDQISGSLDTISGVVTSVLPTWDVDTQTWVNLPTNNPAWVLVDLLTGPMNKRPLDRSRLHIPSILEWANMADEIPTSPFMPFERPRYTCNFILDYSATLQSVVNSVTNASQASLNLIDGKYGVLLDTKRLTPVQVFTPRNTTNFSSTRRFVEMPDALRVRYVDPDRNWEEYEIVVFRDGYDIVSAETFEEVNAFACTNIEQAWRYGRYLIAQATLRQDVITIEVDFEHLVCTRGDYVLFTQDVMKVGGIPARVVGVLGSVVTIDEEFIFNPLLDYGYTFRSNTTGQLISGTLTILTAFTADLTGDLPGVGDLFVYGETTKVTFDCLVKSIHPSADLSATLTLVEKADAIHDAYKVAIEPYDFLESGLKVGEYTPPAVTSLAITENDWRCVPGGYEYYIDLTWDMPDNSIFSIFEIYVNGNLVDYSNTFVYTLILPPSNLGVEIDIRVLAVTQDGKKLEVSEASGIFATAYPKTTPPSDVSALYLNITGEVLQIEWPLIPDCDVNQYLIRYSPDLNAIWENATQLAVAARNQTMTSVQARTGTYLIKAIDYAGNLSDREAKAVTTIPELFNLNIIEEMNDFPSLIGPKIDVVNLGGALTLRKTVFGGIETSEYVSEGEYIYSELLDLGDIYTCRIQSNIRAEGFSEQDLMENWISLDQVTTLSTPGFADWDVETFVRSRDNYDTMAQWTSLDAVPYIYQGEEDDWGAWRKCTIGDFTGRVFQFKIVLKSFKLNVTPSVFSGIIKIDMPDRIDSYRNLVTPAGPFNLVYVPAFAGPLPSPSIQVTQDAMQIGDYFLISNKSLTGFTITFYNSDNVIVSRQFDCMVRGYGRKSVKSL